MHIPGYRIAEQLGQGGMATVYLGEQESLGRKVALKVMAPVLAADPDFGTRFFREGRTIAHLAHPHIINVHDIGETEQGYYLVMEYVPGGDLKQCLANGALPPQQALEILRQVASALGYAHRQGFVHRDVKPENILFRADGTVVLTDFGIAKAVGAGTRMTATGMTIGTSHYMSPEQARGQEVDGRSDIYSLGVVFYEMLTGNVPYQAADSFAVALKHINDPVPQLSGELAVYQPLLDRMLAKEPDQRFPEAALLIGELERCLVGHIARPLAQTVVRPAIGATEIPETFQYVKVRSDGQKGIQAPKAAQVQVEEEETMQQRKKSLFPFFFLLLLGAMALAGAIATGR